MKLCSKFHDYYDTALGFGIDPNIVYIREEEEITDQNLIKEIFHMFEENSGTQSKYSWNDRLPLHNDFDLGLIGFCGKAYPFIECTNSSLIGFKYHQKIWSPIEYCVADKRWHSKFKATEKYFKSFECDDVFIKLGHPIFVFQYNNYGRQKKLSVNCNLKEYDFQKRVDSYTAFQELSMYIGNQLAMVHPLKMVQISDNDMLHKKGFDKWSFRKHSEDK